MKNIQKKMSIIALILVSLLAITGCSKSPEKEQTKKSAPKSLELETPDSNQASTDKNDVDKLDDNEDEAAKADTDSKAETNETADSKEASSNKKGILIALDPGHQSPQVDMSAQEPNAPGSSVMKRKATGGTSGQFSGLPEYELALTISLKLRDRLESQGYDVMMTRENNETAISNAERATLANNANANLSLRIHANGSESSSANGALVLVSSASNPYVGHLYAESSNVGQTILNSYCEATGINNLGLQENDTMTGINWSKVPVMILEMGFMTNQNDDLQMADANFQEKMVTGIVNGINKYYGF